MPVEIDYNSSTNINLGCGDQHLAGFIGLDIRPRAGTDVICDLERPLPLATQSVDFAYAKSLMEHISDLVAFLTEVQRVLKPGGNLYIYVPHWSNPFYYSDYSHQRFFGLATFDYFSNPDKQIYRKVPTYIALHFEVTNIRLLFDSPFRPLRWLLKGLQWVVNRGASLQLFYEFHLSPLIPCYAIEYHLIRTSHQVDA